MSSRREEKERLRAERIAAEKRDSEQQRRRLVAGYFVAALLGAAVLAGIVVAIAGSGGDEVTSKDFPANAHIEPLSGGVEGVEPDDREGTTPPPLQQGDLEEAAKLAKCELQLDLPDEGNTHTDEDTVDYRTDPPTSGNHNPNPQADGAYSEAPALVNVVHSLEHGRVVIHYSPDLPEDEQLAIKGVFDEDPAGMLLFPNPELPYAVAATAWTQLLGCPTYKGDATLDVLRDFRDIYRGNGPEGQVPIDLSG